MSTDVAALVNWRFTVGPGSSRGNSLISSKTSSANRRARSLRPSDCSDTPRAVARSTPEYPIPQLQNSPTTRFPDFPEHGDLHVEGGLRFEASVDVGAFALVEEQHGGRRPYVGAAEHLDCVLQFVSQRREQIVAIA